MWYLTPGKSFTLPPLTNTIECSWRLWPSPGMYAFTSLPLVNLTLATLRIAEFGFFGVVVYTRVHTPRRGGRESKAPELLFLVILALRFRPTCEIVPIYNVLQLFKIITSPLSLALAHVAIFSNNSNVH